jgi:hypothetical protein
MISSGDKHNILPSLGKPPAKISPDAPSTKDSDTHNRLLKKDSLTATPKAKVRRLFVVVTYHVLCLLKQERI